MKPQEFENLVTHGAQRRQALLALKGHDYDKVEDRLSGLKEVAAICNTLQVDGRTNHTASGIATVLLLVKLVRDANLKNSGKEPLNEGRLDTYDDTHNYLDLKLACELDESIQPVAVKSK